MALAAGVSHLMPTRLQSPIFSPSVATEASRVNYLRQMQERVVHTVRRAISLCPDRSASILDIGRSRLSRELLAYYDTLTTLGLPLEVTRRYPHSAGWDPPAGKSYADHIVCNLNEAQYLDRLDVGRPFDLVIFGDVIEHLTTAPELVLALLRSLLRDGGYILCTTPNAVSLNKRVWLAVGRNPFNRIRLDPDNPGHFREYTKSELYEIGATAGLTVVSHEYFDDAFAQGSPVRRAALALAHQLARVMPSLSASQTIVYRRGVAAQSGGTA